MSKQDDLSLGPVTFAASALVVLATASFVGKCQRSYFQSKGAEMTPFSQFVPSPKSTSEGISITKELSGNLESRGRGEFVSIGIQISKPGTYTFSLIDANVYSTGNGKSSPQRHIAPTQAGSTTATVQLGETQAVWIKCGDTSISQGSGILNISKTYEGKTDIWFDRL